MSGNTVIMANNEAARIYHKKLQINKSAKDYLSQRGLTDEIINKHMVGYADNTRVTTTLKSLGLPTKHLESFDGQGDYFYNRIIFPLFSLSSVTYFTSRSFPEHKPPHLHMRGKIKSIYNQNALTRAKYVFVVESPICCLTLEQNGINAISILGGHGLNNETIELIPSNIKIYLVPDIDPNNAGIKAAGKTAAMLANNGAQDIKVVYLSDTNETKTDVNSYMLTHTKDDLRHLVKLAKSPGSLDSFNIELERLQQKATVRKEERIFSEVTETKEKVTMLDIANYYCGGYRAHGSVDCCKCPFHDDSRPSLMIYSRRGEESWYCFSCGDGGDIIEFVKRIENVSFKEALDVIRERFSNQF